MRKLRWVMVMIWLIPCRLTRNVVLMVKGLNSPTREYRIQFACDIRMEKCISWVIPDFSMRRSLFVHRKVASAWVNVYSTFWRYEFISAAAVASQVAELLVAVRSCGISASSVFNDQNRLLKKHRLEWPSSIFPSTPSGWDTFYFRCQDCPFRM